MKEIYVISAYTPNFQKQESLRLLVNSISKQNKDVMVISHSPIPKDIEEICKYTIYDSENKLVYDTDSQFWSYSRLADKKFEFINLKSSITILACWKLSSGAFSYLKTLGYDIIHFLEYDSEINDFTHFEEAKEIISGGEYDLVGFKPKNENEYNHLTLPISFNVKKLSFEQLQYDENFLVSEYKKRYHSRVFPITEGMAYDILWSKLKIKAEDTDKIENVMKINQNYTFGFTDKYCVHVVDGMLHIVHDNLNNLKPNILDILIYCKDGDSKTKSFMAPYYKCVWVNLGVNYSDALYIKIFVNGAIFKELDLRKPNDRFYIDSARIISE